MRFSDLRRDAPPIASGVAFLLLQLACSDADPTSQGTTLEAISRVVSPADDIRALYSATRANDAMKALVAIGPRVAGSDAEKAAADQVTAAFTDMGLAVDVEEAPIVTYYEDRGSTIVKENCSENCDIQASPMNFSPPSDITAALVDCGLGFPGECKSDVRGKIALIKRGVLPFAFKANYAAQAGAAAVIVWNSQNGGPGPFLAGASPIPIVSITFRDGLALSAELVATPPIDVEVNLKVNTTRNEGLSRNVIATRFGTDPSQGTLYVGAHLDTLDVDFYPPDAGVPDELKQNKHLLVGANDNAASIGALLEAARVLQIGHKTKATIKFVAFGGEEQGAFGAIDFVIRHVDALFESGLGMVNLELIGVGDHIVLGNNSAPQNLVDYAVRKADAMGLEAVAMRIPYSSDHLPFEWLGFPTLVISRAIDVVYDDDGEPRQMVVDPAYDTPNDTAAHIEPLLAEEVGELATAFAYDWAKNPPLRDRKAALR